MADSHPTELLSMADLLTPAAIRAAATLGVADHIAGGATTASAVAEQAGAQPDVMAALLRHLAELGVLRKENTDPGGEQQFALTPLGDPLRSDHPTSVTQVLSNDTMMGAGTQSLLRLDHTVRTGEPAFAAGGDDYWETVNQEQKYAREWAQQAAVVEEVQDRPLNWGAENILTAYDWATARTVVDVGGNLGVILTALLRKHPHLHGTLVDLKNASEQASRRFAASDIADRASAVVGSFFDPLPPGADVYLISAILADWADADAVRILRRCRDAAAPHGKVLLAEVIMPSDGPATELRLRAIMPAPSRSIPQLEVLGAEAGLEVSWRGPNTPVRTLLEFTPR